MSRSRVAWVALPAALAMTLSACGGGGGTNTADGNYVGRGSDIEAGTSAQGDIIAAGAVGSQRKITDSRVVNSGSVIIQRSKADGRVPGARGVDLECKCTDGRVDVGGIVTEGAIAYGRVQLARVVEGKRVKTNRRVLDTGGIV